MDASVKRIRLSYQFVPNVYFLMYLTGQIKIQFFKLRVDLCFKLFDFPKYELQEVGIEKILLHKEFCVLLNSVSKISLS